MTIRQLLNLATNKLKNKSTSPQLDAEVLLAHTLKKPKEYLISNIRYQISKSKEKKLRSLVTKRTKGWPVAYLTHEKEFFGLKFQVNQNVLIPRPETEGLVETALEQIKDLRLKIKNNKPIRILDIGTGSGNIIISLAYNLQLTTYNFFGSDISPKALAVARRNARLHKTRISFKQSNLLENWTNQHFDIIIANLPYGWRQWKNNTTATTIGLQFEPQEALFTSKNGLALYEKLFKQISTLHPQPSTLFLEFDPRQTRQIKNLVNQWLPGYKCEISKDLAGLDRLAMLSRRILETSTARKYA